MAKRKYTGSSQDYYRVDVNDPTSSDIEPYTAECNDIIEALDLNFAEGNILKAIWRIAAWRNGWHDKVSPAYDSEKVSFFADRVHRQNH